MKRHPARLKNRAKSDMRAAMARSEKWEPVTLDAVPRPPSLSEANALLNRAFVALNFCHAELSKLRHELGVNRG